MRKYIFDFEWQDGTHDWRGVEASTEERAIEIFRAGGSFKGSYKDVAILKIEQIR